MKMPTTEFTGMETVKRAVYEVADPAMDKANLLEGRGDLEYPVVLWAKAANRPGWNRCSPVVELSVAKRWYRSWEKTYAAVAITSAHRISRTLQLPSY